jgi:hypothetical protein
MPSPFNVAVAFQDGVGIGTRNNIAGDKAIEERADDGHARVP